MNQQEWIEYFELVNGRKPTTNVRREEGNNTDRQLRSQSHG